MHNRRTNIVLLACSLLLAAGMWLVHILSQSYFAYVPFSIRAVTDIQGYAPKSVSVQTLFLGGKASGFFLLEYNLSKKQPIEIEVEIPFGDDDFTVKSTSISDRISESVNSYFEMTYVPETELTFEFEPRQYKRVPIDSRIVIRCQPQYMEISDIVFEPDSVTVYGNESDLEKITSISTRSVMLKGLKKSTGGIVAMERDKRLRISPENVNYSVQIARYYEYSCLMNLSTVNVPADKNLILFPSQVEVTWRLPFAAETDNIAKNVRFVVDYNDIVESRSYKVAPQMEDNDVLTYSYSVSPAFVECIVVEENR